LGEYVESLSDVQGTLREIRKTLDEIPILASEQMLLDEDNRGEKGGEDGNGSAKKHDKLKAGGERPRVLSDGRYAIEISTSTA
jgi:coatomer subunit beta